jgi:hypothetical protein
MCIQCLGHFSPLPPFPLLLKIRVQTLSSWSALSWLSEISLGIISINFFLVLGFEFRPLCLVYHWSHSTGPGIASSSPSELYKELSLGHVTLTGVGIIGPMSSGCELFGGRAPVVFSFVAQHPHTSPSQSSAS